MMIADEQVSDRFSEKSLRLFKQRQEDHRVIPGDNSISPS